MKNSHEITIQGRKHLDFVRKTFNRDVIWLPNCFLGADLRKYEPARISPIGDGEYFRISFVGYLIPDKGVDILLRATAELSKEMPIELTLIGHVSPEIEQELNLAKTRQSKNFKLNLTGRLEFHELLPLLQQSHMFVFNSRFFGEGHPNVINEAMAMGLPIVASTNGFLEDIVSDKNGGVVHDPKSVTELIEKIRKLSSDWETLRMKGKMARRLVEEVFVDEVVLKTTQNIYTRELSSDNRHQIEEHYQNWLRSD